MAVCVDGDTWQNLNEHGQVEKVMDLQVPLFACEFILAAASARSKCDVHCSRLLPKHTVFDQPLLGVCSEREEESDDLPAIGENSHE